VTPSPTVQFASFVYADGPELDDPAETYHEAAKLQPSFALRQVPGLSSSDAPAILESSRRSSRRHPHRPRIALPAPRRLRAQLEWTLTRRVSRPPRPGSTLSLDDVARLTSAYAWDARRPRRHVPSGGGLYPLEQYVLARSVESVPPGVYHVDPCDRALELLAAGAPEVRHAFVEPSLGDAAAILVVTSCFWRSRWKYGLRGYRFALLEAGHLVQTVLLLATATGVDALPLGGFYDAVLDDAVGADGVNESVVYAVALGRPLL
jgi:SagB-type dehydrogenase family enzyme